MGEITGPDAQVGHLAVIQAHTLHPEGEARGLGDGSDIITFRNLLQAVRQDDYFAQEEWVRTSLASSKEDFVKRAYDAVSPGGRVLGYSVGVDPFLAESAIERTPWESAGSEIIEFDRDDRGAAIGIGLELGWDKQAAPLEETVRARYMLLRRADGP